ncbi:primosomal protein N', partial [Verrucomicrobiota bacterium]
QAMSSIAKVIVDVAVGREFDYAIPDKLAPSVAVGSRVVVPFGKRRVDGYVVDVCGESKVAGLKEIASLVDDKPFISEKLLELARWMADYYCAPVEASIRTVLPGAVRRKGKGFKKRLFVSLAEEKSLESGGPPPHPKSTDKQRGVLELLEKKGGAFLHELTAELEITAGPVKALEKKGLVRIEPMSALRDPLANKNILRTKHLELMPEQEEAVEMIKECVATAGKWSTSNIQHPTPNVQVGKDKKQSTVVLLHGVTGSGKTEVYLQAIDHVLGLKRGAIVLVPEISLTPQTVERFVARFGERIAVLHSHLSEGERHDEWHRIRDGKAQIVIGARSAVFAPVAGLGLIVVDEEHEPSYKQEDAPRYNARDVAVMRGKMEGCAVVLGSATPALESWHNAGTGKYRLAELPRRADNRRMPHVRVVDMRLEAEATGHVSALSRDLVEAIRSRLDRAEQVMLFLNRRGFATSLICRQCGYVAGCDDCSVSYTYHKNDDLLRCHICGGDRKVPARCPGCNDPSFKYSGMGTQRIEAIVRKCFRHANVQRMDADMTKRKDSYDRILGDFRVGKTDILIGTQMIAKGLHFPNVTLVGVVYADLSLHLPDFRAGERTFQLLAQVAGRAGRGEVPGEVIVQTYTPFHMAVQAARRVDYEGFCDQELEFRRELNYPPFARLLCMTFRGPSEDKVSFYAATVARRLKKAVAGKVIVSEPAPAPLSKAKGQYRYQVMLRSASAKAMTGPVSDVLRDIKFPKGMTCSVDVDALSLL